ncbi:MAG: type I 3-dehydroquinate dehydratase [Fibrobacteria bacterium]|nr:type I 3-dehydroquinate dehydratase [Fibrobacteria bacterium]
MQKYSGFPIIFTLIGRRLIINQYSRIVGIITRDNFEWLLNGDSQFSESVHAAGILEFRADTFPQAKIPKIAEKFSEYMQKTYPELLTIFTIRLPKDGGQWEGVSEERWPVVDKVLEQGHMHWFDIEIEEILKLPKTIFDKIKIQQKKLVLSHHNFSQGYTINEYQDILAKMELSQPDIIKFAVTAQTELEIGYLLEFSQDLVKNYPLSCAVSIGPYGVLSRIASPLVGAPLSYGYLGGEPTVPGQISVQKLKICLTEAYQNGLYRQSVAKIIDFIKEKWPESIEM